MTNNNYPIAIEKIHSSKQFRYYIYFSIHTLLIFLSIHFFNSHAIILINKFLFRVIVFLFLFGKPKFISGETYSVIQLLSYTNLLYQIVRHVINPEIKSKISSEIHNEHSIEKIITFSEYSFYALHYILNMLVVVISRRRSNKSKGLEVVKGILNISLFIMYLYRFINIMNIYSIIFLTLHFFNAYISSGDEMEELVEVSNLQSAILNLNTFGPLRKSIESWLWD